MTTHHLSLSYPIQLRRERNVFSVVPGFRENNNKESVMHYMGACLIHLLTLWEKQKQNDQNAAFIFTAFKDIQQYKRIDITITKESTRFVIGDFALIEYRNENKFEVQALNGVSLDEIYAPLVNSPKFKASKAGDKEAITPECFDRSAFCFDDKCNEDVDKTIILISYRLTDEFNGPILEYEKEFQPKAKGDLSAFTCTVIANIYRPHGKYNAPAEGNFFGRLEADQEKEQERENLIAAHIKKINDKLKMDKTCYSKDDFGDEGQYTLNEASVIKNLFKALKELIKVLINYIGEKIRNNSNKNRTLERCRLFGKGKETTQDGEHPTAAGCLP